MTKKTDADTTSMIQGEQLKLILEAALLAAGQPLSQVQLAALFSDEERPPAGEIGRALEQLKQDCTGRAIELKKVASGYRMQVRQDFNEWVSRLWKERPKRYSRALLETMALIAYRQPITRGEIEAVRGVSVRTSIIRTLQEREWIRVVGHRDVPGKPALFGTTKTFLDSFDLQNLDDLPTLAEIRDMETLEPELQLDPAPPAIDVQMADIDGDDEDEDEDDEEQVMETSPDKENEPAGNEVELPAPDRHSDDAPAPDDADQDSQDQ